MPISVERYLQNLPLIAILRQAPWGFSTQRVFAMDPDVNSEWGDCAPNGDVVYPVVAAALELVSTNAADAAAGTGARTVLVEGLDGNYVPINETVILNGTTPVALVNSYLRINGMRVVTAGSAGRALGNVDLYTAVGNNTQAVLSGEDLENVSMASHFTVPANRTAYIIGAKYSSDAISTRFRLLTRSPGGVFIARDAFQVGVSPADPPYFVPVEVPEKTDIKVVAKRRTSETALAFVSYDLIIAPKSLSAVRSLGAPAV